MHTLESISLSPSVIPFECICAFDSTPSLFDSQYYLFRLAAYLPWLERIGESREKCQYSRKKLNQNESYLYIRMPKLRLRYCCHVLKRRQCSLYNREWSEVECEEREGGQIAVPVHYYTRHEHEGVIAPGRRWTRVLFCFYLYPSRSTVMWLCQKCGPILLVGRWPTETMWMWCLMQDNITVRILTIQLTDCPLSTHSPVP